MRFVGSDACTQGTLVWFQRIMVMNGICPVVSPNWLTSPCSTLLESPIPPGSAPFHTWALISVVRAAIAFAARLARHLGHGARSRSGPRTAKEGSHLRFHQGHQCHQGQLEPALPGRRRSELWQPIHRRSSLPAFWACPDWHRPYHLAPRLGNRRDGTRPHSRSPV